MTDELLLEHKQNIAILTLNRPKQRNALDPAVINQLIETLKILNEDNQTRVLLLNASGKDFCAGADLNWMQQSIRYSEAENLADAKQLSELMHILANLNKPTVALVQGATYGGGVGLVACCDIAIATHDAKFCFSEVKLGLIPAVISPYVIAAIGPRAAGRYFLTAEHFSADTAKQLGLIHEVVTTGDLTTVGRSLAQQLQQNAPLAIQQSKALIKRISHNDTNIELRDMTTTLIAKTRVSPEAQTGIRAFLNKEIPSWK